MKIEIDREDDGRWIAEVPDLPGVMVYGSSREEAISKVKALASRVLETISKPDQRLKAIRRIPWKGIANGQKKTNSYTVANDLARSG